MSKHACNIEDLFDLFEDSLSPADVITSKLMAQISTAITKERLKLSMNQATFAKHIGATQCLVSRWEHGDYNFSIRKIAEIAAKLDLDVNFTTHSMSLYKTIEEFNYNTPTFPYTSTVIYSSNKNVVKTNSTYPSKSYVKSFKSKEDNYYASVC